MLFHEVIKETGITKKALLYYEEKGLIEVLRNENGYREYREDQLLILWKIKVLRQLDFSISEIENILKKEHDEEIFQDHFNEIDKRMALCRIQKAYIKAVYNQKDETCSTYARMDQELKEEYEFQDSVKITMQEDNKQFTSKYFMEFMMGCFLLFCDKDWLPIVGLIMVLHVLYIFVRSSADQDGLFRVYISSMKELLRKWKRKNKREES